MDPDGLMFDGDIGMELRAQDLKIDELTRQIEEYQQSNEMLRQQRAVAMGQMQPMDDQ